MTGPRAYVHNALMRTEMTLQILADRLQQNCGDMLDAARYAGVSLVFVEQWQKDDQEVANRLQEACRVGTQGLYSAAIQRAVRGVEEDVYYKGEVVGQKRNYSDGLLTQLLKAKLPEFASGEGAGVSVSVNIANVMPRAETYEAWLEAKTRTLAPPEERLPAPAIQEAEYEPVPFQGIDL